MKRLALTVLSGPLLMALLCGLGMPCGYYLGFIASVFVLVVVAVALGVLLARFTERVTAMLAVVMAILPGLASAYGFHTLHELNTGAFAVGVSLVDLPKLEGHERLTLRDGEAREELFEITSHKSVAGAGSTQKVVVTECEAYPIVAKGWTRSDPVTVWRFGDDDPAQGKPLGERVFRPSAPDELCRSAIDRVIANRHLVDGAHPVYLEAMVSDSQDPSDNRYAGPFAVAFLGALWISIALYVSAREALGEWWRRRRHRST
ncbi:MAG: hypothetical protein ABI551_05280 [Polyangiaceae bacterium]